MKKLLLLIPVLCLVLAFLKQETITVTGQVKAADGTVIVNATIKEKGKTATAVTDDQGNFSITVSHGNATLVITAMGYQSQELALKSKKKLSIILAEQEKELEDVVVMGYNKQLSSKSKRMYAESAAPVMDKNFYAPPVIVADEKVIGGDKDYDDFNTEGYDHIQDNKFLRVTDNPLSTFSIDVDAASYGNVRRFLNNGSLPPAGSVRIEEMINYFHYNYPQPAADKPFTINTEMTQAPWNKDHKLVMIGMQGKRIATDKLPASNLTFLIDVSGSMEDENKLPLVKASMKMLTDQLRENDKVSIVVYAGAAGLVLKPTSGANKIKIKEAIDNLEAGGSTAGGEGIRLAYKTAKQNFIAGGNNRVILCSDGDFNVGESSDDAMERLIETERKAGVYLTVLGYGMGNYKDSKMQKLAQKGNGNHAYIDDISEAKKVLVNEFGGTMFAIAKDVKLQVEFNPALVQGYRLIGYENRMLAKEDFNDDKKDAGELGSGHTVTAIYEIIPAGIKDTLLGSVDALKYQQPVKAGKYNGTEMMTVKARYKPVNSETSLLLEYPISNSITGIESASENLRFSASVAAFGMLLRNSDFKGVASYDMVLQLAKKAKGVDEEGYRAEFVKLVEKAKYLSAKDKPVREVDYTSGR
ncbi:von Willebrand factor type A domain-containing protein [Terrimonas rubra]|uniref:von Willebrand factor type A domain-containing protein n=1 Tax=Terrimonas rubra TaxID=1035890 RepID=A0ABW6A9I8_9BACT